MRNILKRSCSVLLGLLFGLSVQAAADYPAQPVTIVVPFPSGGTSSAVATALRSRLSDALGQHIVIEHIAGGAGSVGAIRLKNSPADGYTIMIASLTTYVVGPLRNRNPAYDPMRDFDLLTVAVRVPNVLVVHPSVPAHTVGEFITYLKKHSGTARFSTSGAGGQDQLTMEMFWQRTGTRGALVHRKGSAPAVADIVAGKVDASIQNLSVALPQIEAGQLRALAVTGVVRTNALPTVPTLREAGVPDVETYSWQGIAAPRGLPQQIKTRLHEALIAALAAPEVRRRLMRDGFEIVGNTPAEFEAFMRTEIDDWQAIIDQAQRDTD